MNRTTIIHCKPGDLISMTGDVWRIIKHIKECGSGIIYEVTFTSGKVQDLCFDREFWRMR